MLETIGEEPLSDDQAGILQRFAKVFEQTYTRFQDLQKAEEQAAKMGTKLVFPLVFCMFPVFFIVAIGPAVIRIIDAFGIV